MIPNTLVPVRVVLVLINSRRVMDGSGFGMVRLTPFSERESEFDDILILILIFF